MSLGCVTLNAAPFEVGPRSIASTEYSAEHCPMDWTESGEQLLAHTQVWRHDVAFRGILGRCHSSLRFKGSYVAWTCTMTRIWALSRLDPADTQRHDIHLSLLAARCSWPPWQVTSRAVKTDAHYSIFLTFSCRVRVLSLLPFWPVPFLLSRLRRPHHQGSSASACPVRH